MTTSTNSAQHRGESARNAGFSLYPWEIAEIRKFAEQHTGGDVSALVRRAMASIGCPLDPAKTAALPDGPLVGLARRYGPAHFDAIKRSVVESDQSAILERWVGECRELLDLGAPLSAIHLASEHEISAAVVPLHARRYIPRLPRARWVAAQPATYPDSTPRNVGANEDPEPVRHRLPRE